MTVKELMEELENYDEDATVLMCSQVGYPFEYSIGGLTERDEIPPSDDDEDEPTDGRSNNDVLILEGTQLRYGTTRAWGVC